MSYLFHVPQRSLLQASGYGINVHMPARAASQPTNCPVLLHFSPSFLSLPLPPLLHSGHVTVAHATPARARSTKGKQKKGPGLGVAVPLMVLGGGMLAEGIHRTVKAQQKK